ncbi:unnamed protein product [Spirodela intermedia]|uniref:Protein kinase domain-containing protein n=1 Tax=Spirodela intermedia TaxID=51605 RepID=A0A7I8J6D4_SPIIN|nr:unnamed protein product [Spirodela intermedia]CAA6665305.1 unnamed protein product [Spirodela intermedia]
MKMPTLTAWSKLTELSLRLALSSFLLSSLAWAADLPPDDCLPRHCGNGVNVSYPFWLDGFQHSTAVFLLSSSPAGQISQSSASSKMITTFGTSSTATSRSSSPTLASQAQPAMCPAIISRLPPLPSPSSRPRAASSSSSTVRPNSQPPGYVPINCRNGSKGLSFVGRDQVNASACKSVISFPIYNDALDILKPGFLLRWRAVNCSECLESGGRCRYDAKQSRRKNRKWRSHSSDLLFRSGSLEPSLKKNPESGSLQCGTQYFRYEELHEATNGFNPSSELGDGGFGTVYKGKLRDGRIVAVKRLYENNFKRVEQFMNEVEILNRLRHHNLVSLYGCTSRHSRELLLVYEFVPNGTVADHLHGNLAPRGALTWPLRLRVALETATALAYLHAVEPQIIHRDVKTNNILLDGNFHVKGTPGYVDPEYHQCYHLTDKSDVYSFGVVLVELISSMPAVDITRRRHEINLSSMAIGKIQSGDLAELVDPKLGFETDWEVKRMITVSWRCSGGWRAGTTMRKEERTGEMEEPTKTTIDEMRLLKKVDEPPSPDTVMHQWSSRPPHPTPVGNARSNLYSAFPCSSLHW